MKFINSSKAVVLSLCVLSLLHINAQNAKEEKSIISTKPFTDGTNHWYHIKDASNIVNPAPDQPQYAENEYAKIADNILLFQRNNGGWPKNYDMKAILTPAQIDTVIKTKSILHTTFDNETTYTHVHYLAQVYTLTKETKYMEGVLKGIDFILEAQYDNGGWPQYFPLEKGYSRHITFNDGAYMGIMNLLKKIVNNDADYVFIDQKTREKVTASYQKGIDCILKMQIVDNGKLTAWCQQHDEITLLPAWARKFEPPSICNAESVDVVLFLMAIDNPDQKIINSVQSAVKWFQDSKIYNTRVESFKAPEMESKYKKITNDVRVVTDTTAPPIWTRYYELKTHKPLFSDRDSQLLYSLAEVSRERRSGYAWYTDKPEKALKKYPAWQKKWAPDADVLKQ
ncbi:pectate lyase [Flavobacterium sp. Root901]|uniref:pectate lyase n=1 Tax=Flavobacterium sp. Root901 TaxID=1736605 RepID=UPI00070AC1DA|nr:pectate lyase [Flavobacterium sp. Root901]KRD08949.1 pectate lyase [Flavobacterium sp. Root901]